MTLTDKAKQKIDSLSLAEVRAEVLKDNASIYQGKSNDYLLARLAELQEEKKDAQRIEDIKSDQEKTNIAKEANEISKQANKHSKIAIWVAGIALVLSALNYLPNSNDTNKTDAVKAPSNDEKKP